MKNLRELKNKKVCVATSGGMDSTALLHYLKEKGLKYGFSLLAVHCEHGIRGEASVADMRFVQELCKAWSIPLFIFREDCLEKAKREKVSLETAARAFRYHCFETLISDGKADFVATAHHLKDEAETVLFRIARGAALSGAAGMHAQRTGFIRPFLDWTKEEIYAYAKENGLSFCEDETNEQTEYTRNKLRLNVLPALEEAVPNAMENIARFARLAAEDDEYLYKISERLLTVSQEDGLKKVTVAFEEEKTLFRRACLTAMKTLGLERDYTAVHLESVYRLQESERGAYLTLPKNVRAQKTESGIVFSLYAKKEPIIKNSSKPFTLDGFDGGVYAVNISLTPYEDKKNVGKTLRLDLNELPKDAVFRFREEGDEIECFGGGTKTLKKFFNEKKVPVEDRAYLPLIASGKVGTVYAVCGYEIADRIKVTDETKETLFVTLWKK